MTIDDRPDPAKRARTMLIGSILAIVVASVVFRLLVMGGLNHTALVFIGIPTVLAIITAFLPSPTSATGMIVKVTTLALLIAGILLGEAFVCILFAAPLFYAAGIVIGLVVDVTRRRRADGAGLSLKSLVFVAVMLTPASMEGVLPGFEFERDDIVTATRIVDASWRDVAAALSRTPEFNRPLPAFFKLGFPTPGRASGAGLAVGDRREIDLEHSHHAGTLVLQIRSSAPGRVAFDAVSDESYITHWLSWRRSEVRWIEVAPGQTLVTWTLDYRRRLDPAWYFAPLERYGATLAAGYLIDTLATPSTDRPRVERRRTIDAVCRRLVTPRSISAK